MAASIAPPGGAPDIWVYDLASRVFNRLSFSPTAGIGAAWTPDGQYVSYRTATADGPKIVRNGGTAPGRRKCSSPAFRT